MGSESSRRPTIGLPGRRKLGAQTGFPAAMGGISVDIYLADFARAVLEAGGRPVHLPFDADPADYVDLVDGIILPGGADLDPALYGAESETDEFPPEPERDRFELDLLDAAFGADLPVLGVCRGLQLLNVHGGGTLHQDVPEHARWDAALDAELHEVHLVPDTLAAELYGPTTRVNTLHHQTIDRLARGWVASGHAPDGTIETIELPGRNVFAVQWHPEWMAGRPHDPAFAWLLHRCRARARVARS